MTNLLSHRALRPSRSGLRALALWAALALCGAACAPAVAAAAEADPHGPSAEAPAVATDHAVERVGTFGIIDWTAMRAVATGTGVSPTTAADPARARAMAERAAMLDARRNLLEVVGSVRMDARTTVRDFMTASDTVRSAVVGVLRGAQIEALTLRPDGSVRAVASLPLTGNLVEVLRSAPPLAPRAAPGPGPAVAPAPGTDPAAREALARSRLLEQRVAALEAELAEQRRTTRTMAARLDELDRLLDEAARLNRQEAQQQAQQQAEISDVEGRAAADRDAALAAQFETLRAAHRALAERLRHLEERPVPAPSAVATAAPAPLGPSVPSALSVPPAPAAPAPPVQPVPSAPPAPAPSAAAAPPASTSAPLPGPTPEQAAALGHTGIVVDARGLNFTPSLNPRLADATGATLYPPPDADGAGLAKRGAVRYFRDLSQAQRSARAGASPLTIKPAGLAADGSLTLGGQDAALLRALAGAPHTPVRDLNVVVVF